METNDKDWEFIYKGKIFINFKFIKFNLIIGI